MRTFYAAEVDPVSWTDGYRWEVIDGNVNRTPSGIRQTAELDCRNFPTGREMWIRIYMDTDKTHDALFTGVCSSPKRDIDGHIVKDHLECLSVLQPSEDLKLPRGWYLPKGANAGSAIKKLLKGVKLVIADGIPNLTDYIVAEDNESHLSMVDAILKMIGWRMSIDGYGVVKVEPQAVTPSVIFSKDSRDVLQETFSISRDWFECPNVVKVTSGNGVAEARDDDPDSELSTVSRGREIMLTENDVTLGSDEGLYQYAKRRLAEEQKTAEKAQYTRKFVSGLNVSDIVGLNYKSITGDYVITKQKISLTFDGDTSEEVERFKTTKPIVLDHWFTLVLPDDCSLIMPDDRRLIIRR